MSFCCLLEAITLSKTAAELGIGKWDFCLVHSVQHCACLQTVKRFPCVSPLSLAKDLSNCRVLALDKLWFQNVVQDYALMTGTWNGEAMFKQINKLLN